MNINIYDYLQDFEKMDLANDHGVILEDEERMTKLDSDLKMRNSLFHYLLDNKHKVYVKKQDYKSAYLSELLASRIYEKNGVNCIRSYPFYKKNVFVPGKQDLCVLTEDLSAIKGLTLSQNNDFLMRDLYAAIHFLFDEKSKRWDEWLLLTDEGVKNFMLEFMTKDGYNQMLDVNILDFLFHIYDRYGNGKNMFFGKKAGSKKISTVVPFDMEGLNFDLINEKYDGSVDKFIEDVCLSEICFTTTQGSTAEQNYLQRLIYLKKLIQEGYFSNKNIDLMKNTLGLNIENEIGEILNKYDLNVDECIIKAYKELWNIAGDALAL